MAKKNEPSLENAINTFEDAMQRASLSDYFHVNRILLSKSPKEYSVLIPVDQMLWNGIVDKAEFKDHLREFDLNNPSDQANAKVCLYAEESENDSWIELDSDLLYSGKIIKLTIDGLEYEISINKNLIPLKLKKSEFNNISYKVFPNDMTLALRKRFNYHLDDHGFSIIRLFQII